MFCLYLVEYLYFFIIKIIGFNILELFIGLIIPNNNSVIVKDIFISKVTFNQSLISLIIDFVFGHCQKMFYCFLTGITEITQIRIFYFLLVLEKNW